MEPANVAFKLQKCINLGEKGGMTPVVVQSSAGPPRLPWTQKAKGLGDKAVSSLGAKDGAPALIPMEQTANTQVEGTRPKLRWSKNARMLPWQT